ncbi:MAG TPA: uracil-DNA glycosylase [Blastocatellia bacterium]|nr:uracil-DNA glycosylase [Blastocatellia bacterium]
MKPKTVEPTAAQKRTFNVLVRQASECRLCPRMCGRSAVLSDKNGVLNAKVFFIGEAPGQKGADRTRTPFSGDISGRNFDALIESIGLTRKDIFISSAAMCNPRTEDGRKNDKPTTAEVRNCNSYLKSLIDLIDPPVVATLGSVALSALHLIEPHMLKLSDAAGKAHKWNNRVLVPLYHPSQRVLNKARPMPDQLRDYQMIKKALG